MSKKKLADELWTKLRDSLLDTREAITAIVATKAWEPLGYETFHQAWAEKMSDIDLATVSLTHVVYQMLAEDVADAAIASSVKGVSLAGAAILRRQRDNGVPPEHASVYAKVGDGRPRGASTSRGTLFLHVGPDKLAEWSEIAKAKDSTVADLALPILDRAFSRMQRNDSSL